MSLLARVRRTAANLALSAATLAASARTTSPTSHEPIHRSRGMPINRVRIVRRRVRKRAKRLSRAPMVPPRPPRELPAL